MIYRSGCRAERLHGSSGIWRSGGELMLDEWHGADGCAIVHELGRTMVGEVGQYDLGKAEAQGIVYDGWFSVTRHLRCAALSLARQAAMHVWRDHVRTVERCPQC